MTETTNSPTKPNEPACPECSRLASRVELLEKALDDAVWDIANGEEDNPLRTKDVLKAMYLKDAERALAGAHAEEKSK